MPGRANASLAAVNVVHLQDGDKHVLREPAAMQQVDQGSRMLELHWHDPGTLYKTPDPPEIVKKYNFDEFRRVPGELSQIVKITKIDDFGGPSENHRKIILGSLKIAKKIQKIVLWAT